MLPLFHIKTDRVEDFCQLLEHAIHVVVRWLVFDSFEDFAQSSELRGGLPRFFRHCGFLVIATGSRGRCSTVCVDQRSQVPGLGVLPGGSDPCPRVLDDNVC